MLLLQTAGLAASHEGICAALLHSLWDRGRQRSYGEGAERSSTGPLKRWLCLHHWLDPWATARVSSVVGCGCNYFRHWNSAFVLFLLCIQTVFAFLFSFFRLRVKQSRWESIAPQRTTDTSVGCGGSTVAGASRGRGIGHRLGNYRNIFSQRSPTSSSSDSSSRSPSPSHSRHRDRSNQRHRRRYGTFLLLSLVIVVFLHAPSSNVLLFVSCQWFWLTVR